MLTNMLMAPQGPGDNSTKIETILRLFVNGKRLNRFEAETHHDHCLHTTVSTLERYGVRIDRKRESVPCLNGRKRTSCNRYWLHPSPENIAGAMELLELWRRKWTT